jgi:predicted DCC family thiol-disulfide oxidoreductase YuxK
VLFDGECNLCNGAVQFILRRDQRAVFQFASLQSAAGRQLLVAADAPALLPDSLVLVQNGVLALKSTAALRIARGLRWPWPLFAVFFVVPRPLRDILYDWIARNRYRWFGKREACMVPTPALRARFLDAPERH